jgi:hypothetical protein
MKGLEALHDDGGKQGRNMYYKLKFNCEVSVVKDEFCIFSPSLYKFTTVSTPIKLSPLGRHRCRWKDNTNLDLKETGWRGINWIHLAQDRDKETAVNLKVP